jgi:hypothetical protein
MSRKARGNVHLSYNGTDITAYANSADLQDTIDQIDTTHFASTGKESITGDPEWSLSMGGDWVPEIDAILGPEAVTPGTRRDAAIELVGATATVEYAWTANAEIQNYQVQAQVGGKIVWSATLMLSGAPTRTVT